MVIRSLVLGTMWHGMLVVLCNARYAVHKLSKEEYNPSMHFSFGDLLIDIRHFSTCLRLIIKESTVNDKSYVGEKFCGLLDFIINLEILLQFVEIHKNYETFSCITFVICSNTL